MFKNGVHYAQSQPQMYNNYGQCKAAAAELKEKLDGSKPNDSAYVLSFCVSLPTNA